MLENKHREKNSDSPRERVHSYIINIVGKNLPMDEKGYEGKRRELEGLSLSQSVKKKFGISYREKDLIGELHYLSKYSDILDEMERQRAFTLRYIAMLTDRDPTDKTLRNIISILLKHRVLNIINIPGKSYRSFGMNVYYTFDATSQDIADSSYEYVMQDELRHQKDIQRKDAKRKPKPPEETVAYNDRVSQLSEQKRTQKRDKKIVDDIHSKSKMCCNGRIAGGIVMHTCDAMQGRKKDE